MTLSPANRALPPSDSADEFVKRFVKACEEAELITFILEPSTKVQVQVPGTSHHMAEVITLKPDADERLCWWWSWDEPICLADDLDKAVKMIREVCGVKS